MLKIGILHHCMKLYNLPDEMIGFLETYYKLEEADNCHIVYGEYDDLYEVLLKLSHDYDIEII